MKACLLKIPHPTLDDEELKWEYECEKCHNTFSMKVPKGPKEERAFRCPQCRSGEIVRINKFELPDKFRGG